MYVTYIINLPIQFVLILNNYYEQCLSYNSLVALYVYALFETFARLLKLL